MSLKNRLVAKDWKSRVSAYEELVVLFGDSNINLQEKAQYGQYFKKMVMDSYPRAQEKALEALDSFIVNCSSASTSIASDVSAVIIDKCLSGRTTLQSKAQDVLILFMEKGSFDVVLGQLLKGCGHKVPKTGAMCLSVITQAIKSFGCPPTAAERIYPVLKPTFDHSFQPVREEARLLTIELYRWLGSDLHDTVKEWELRGAQMKDLEASFSSITPNTAVPDKEIDSATTTTTNEPSPSNTPPQEENGFVIFTPTTPSRDTSSRSSTPNRSRSSTPGSGTPSRKTPRRQSRLSSSVEESPGPPSSNNTNEECVTVNILAVCDNEWYRQMKFGKWQTRKGKLDEIVSMCGNNYELTPGDYTKLVNCISEFLGDNKSVMVSSSVKTLGAIAKGLKSSFSVHGKKICGTLLDKLKENKSLVAQEIQDTLFTMYESKCITFSLLNSEISDALSNKIPRIKSGCLHWIGRCLTSKPENFQKSEVPQLANSVLPCLDDSNAKVRNNAYAVLKTLGNMYGEDCFDNVIAESDVDKKKIEKLKKLISNKSVATTPKKHKVESSPRKQQQERNERRRSMSCIPSRAVNKQNPLFSTPQPSIASREFDSLTNFTKNNPHSSPMSHKPTNDNINYNSHNHNNNSNINNNNSSNISNDNNSLPPISHNPLSSSSPSIYFTPTRTTSVPKEPLEIDLSTKINPPNGRRSTAPSSVISGLRSSGGIKTKLSNMPKTKQRGKDNIEGLLEALRDDFDSKIADIITECSNANKDKIIEEEFLSELNSYNQELLIEQENDKRKIESLEKQVEELKRKLKQQKQKEKQRSESQSLPSIEELYQMTEKDLNDVERRQEEYLLTIRKVKIRNIR